MKPNPLSTDDTPDNAKQLVTEAESLFSDGNVSASEDLCHQALKKDKLNADAIGLLALVSYQAGNVAQAKRLLSQAIQITPGNAVHHYRLANIHQDQRNLDEAIACYSEALSQSPNFLAALVNLGNSFLQNRDYKQAINVSLKALDLAPKCIEAISNLGQSYLKSGHLSYAHNTLLNIVQHNPNSAEFRNNYGVVQQLIGDVDGAIKTFKVALNLDPNCRLAERNLKIAVLNSPKWTVKELFNLQKSFCRPYPKIQNSNKIFAEHDFSIGRKLRVGYLTSDFCEHPVGYNLLPLIKHHNQEAVEIYLYSNVESQDFVTNQFIETSDQWRGIRDLNDKQVANIIKIDQIDIMVYLAGRFNGNRPEIAIYRPAPVQISFHDCATTGIEAIDYWLTDPDLHPIETEELFVEKLYRLPQFYQFTVPSNTPHTAPPPVLHNQQVTFGSFNKPEKLNRVVIELWARLLSSIPGSRLLLKYQNFFSDDAMKTLWKEKFKEHGLSIDRISLLSRDDQQADHLALYSQIDICLDPFPFNGATATFEALLMGVPVVALEGKHFVDRVSTTLLKQANLSQFVAKTTDDYLSIARTLALNTKELVNFRPKIREKLLGSNLCNAPRYARQIEKAYQCMWRNRCEKTV